MKLGVQLYTVRDFIATRNGFIETLDKIKAMGYAGVQISATAAVEGDKPEVTAEDAAALLKERGLVCPATHRGLEGLLNDVDAEIAWHKTVGATTIAVPCAPAEVHEKGPDGFRAMLAQLEPVAKKLKAAGINLSYHNHALEFQRFGPKGERPFDVIVNEAPWMGVELDTYWVHHSGTDVVPTINRLKGRLPTVHLKDKACSGWDVIFAPVGEGNLDFPSYLKAFAEAGSEWAFVEQDTCQCDPFDCLDSSIKYLKTILK